MTGSPTATATPERTLSVLVVLVVRDAADWLRETLAALAAQTYPRLAVLAVDNASTDGSDDLLRDALGERRVIVLPRPQGLAGSLRAALELPVASEADFILLLHDDAAMDPDAVSRLVEAAVGIGVERVGVVGPKVVDWEHPRELRDVGRSADLFGHPYAPLQPGEIDQGQFDRVLEVLCVSSAAMLVSRDAWKRAGLFDERLDIEQQGLDFCWRARVTGFRVLMTPLARVRHRSATAAGERAGKERHRSPRYREDRAAIASLLKNYGLVSLLWIIPLALIMGVVRLLFLLLARRFEEAFDLLAAWGWNIAHLPGTWSRRRRVQKARRVKDRQLRRFMESAGVRWPRWFQTAEKILEEQREIEADDQGKPVTRRLRDRTASLVGTHPVIVASALGIAIGAVAIRSFLGPEALAGGALRMFPSSPSGFVAELVSAYRTTAIGGSLPASPALGALGGVSWLMFGSVSLAQKFVLAGAPVLGAVLLYRAASRLTGRPGPSVVAAAAYLLSGVMLWSFSEGRLDLLVALAVLPAAFERVEAAFGRAEPSDGRWRFVAGVGVTLAVLVAFYPGAALAVVVLIIIELLVGAARGRGLALMALSFVAAAILLFPFVPGLVADAGASFSSFIGTTDLWALARSTPGGGPGSWEISAFLPVAALMSFALVGAELRPYAIRAALAVVAGLSLSWLAAAGWLPTHLSNPSAYLGLAAVAEALLVAFGLASVSTGLGREAFGLRQVGTAILVVVLGGGIALQSAAAMVGGWAIGGPDEIPAAWAVVDSAAKGDFRVLWIGEDDGQRFPAPGGDAEGVVDAGAATLLYSITDRTGTSALDIGRPTVGPGIDRLRASMEEILSGTTDHGGALLASFGIRFLVADSEHLSQAAAAKLDAQVDLNLVPAAGLVIYRNASALPPAAVIEADEQALRTIRSAELSETSRLGNLQASPLDQVEGGWSGGQGSGPVFLSTEYRGAWQLEGSDAEPERAAGWATDVRPDAGSGVDPLRSAASRNDPGDPARPGVDRGTVDHPQAGGRMRARGQGILTLALVGVVVVLAVTFDRLGPKEPGVATEPASRHPGCGSVHTVAAPIGRPSVYLANPGDVEVQARVTSMGSERSQSSESVVGPAREPRSASQTPAHERGSSTYVEYFGGWVSAGWVTHGASGEAGIGAEPCAPAPARTWFSTGVSTGQDEQGYLIVMNPFATDAVFDVALFFAPPRSPGRDSELTDVTLAPGRSMAIKLNPYGEGEAAMGVAMEVSSGRVAAATTVVSANRGITSVLASTETARTVYLPDGPGGGPIGAVIVRSHRPGHRRRRPAAVERTNPAGAQPRRCGFGADFRSDLPRDAETTDVRRCCGAGGWTDHGGTAHAGPRERRRCHRGGYRTRHCVGGSTDRGR